MQLFLLIALARQRLFHSAVAPGRLSQIPTEPCWLTLAGNLLALSKRGEKNNFSQISEIAAKEREVERAGVHCSFLINFVLIQISSNG